MMSSMSPCPHSSPAVLHDDEGFWFPYLAFHSPPPDHRAFSNSPPPFEIHQDDATWWIPHHEVSPYIIAKYMETDCCEQEYIQPSYNEQECAFPSPTPRRRRRASCFTPSTNVSAIHLTDADFQGIDDWDDLDKPFPDESLEHHRPVWSFEEVEQGKPSVIRKLEDQLYQSLVNAIEESKPPTPPVALSSERIAGNV